MSIRFLNGSFARGVPQMFHASASDDNDPSGTLLYVWGATNEHCVSDVEAPGPSMYKDENNNVSQPDFQFTPPTSGEYCVWVTVSDPQGASQTTTLGFNLVDNPPKVDIVEINDLDASGAGMPVRPSVPLYSHLHYRYTFSDPDKDDVIQNLKWTLTGPQSKPAAPCGVNKDELCFDADAQGTYQLTLSATDGDGMPAMAAKTIIAADDRPPCIVQTSPAFSGTLVWPAGVERVLRVTKVDDDGDPVPSPADQPSLARFNWSWRFGTSSPFSPDVNNHDRQYSVPIDLEPGRVLQVRVEAQDRRDRPGELDHCNVADAVCNGGLVGQIPNCQRWVTWTVQVQ